MKRRLQRAFTLIELLTVMAITSVLLTLIVVPVFQSFNLFRQGQALADAQEKGRLLVERIAREIGSAQSVRSANGLVTISYNGVATSVPRDSVIAQVPGLNGQTADVVLPHSKLDVILASQGDPLRTRNGAFTNPVYDDSLQFNSGLGGLGDPTISTPRGQVSLPVTPGPVWVRYAIGLRDPLSNYNNPYDGRLMLRNGSRDNLFELYRIEFQPYVMRPNKATPADLTTLAWRPNLVLFDTDASDLQIVNDGLDDPTFLVPNRTAGGVIITNDAKAFKISHWLGQNPDNVNSQWLPKATILTDLSRYDMIQPMVISQGGVTKAIYDGNIPRLISLVSFRPTRVTNEPADGQVAARQGEESDNSMSIGPDVYRTNSGLWDNAVIRTWPAGWLSSDNSRNQYFVGRVDPLAGTPGVAPGFSIYYYDPSSGSDDYVGGTEVFDFATYASVANSNSRFPFTQAVLAANGRSNWLGNANIRNVFTPYVYNSGPGKIIASFAIKEVGDPSKAVNPANPDNLPIIATGNAFSPFTETTLGGNWYDPVYNQNVNTRFNMLWNTFPFLQGDYLERFIDLRVLPNGDGTYSPLAPGYLPGTATGFAKTMIVPGSEEIYGPDQLPGPNYGAPVRYTRTTKRPVGPNQYLINYVDQVEPDYTTLGLPAGALAGFNPNAYDSTNLVSAIIQPRFKRGYISLNSDPNVPIPAGRFTISYRFQFTGSLQVPSSFTAGNKSDVFAVDYDTRQLMSVQLTVRNYPQSNLPNPQNVTLKATASVRNYSR